MAVVSIQCTWDPDRLTIIIYDGHHLAVVVLSVNTLRTSQQHLRLVDCIRVTIKQPEAHFLKACLKPCLVSLSWVTEVG